MAIMNHFSDKFGLNKSQAEQDFVDIPLDTDIRLFLDPYAISLEQNPWFAICINLIVDFFDRLIFYIKKGNKSKSINLLANLHETNDTHLGLSNGKPLGRGIGNVQAI